LHSRGAEALVHVGGGGGRIGGAVGDIALHEGEFALPCSASNSRVSGGNSSSTGRRFQSPCGIGLTSFPRLKGAGPRYASTPSPGAPASAADGKGRFGPTHAGPNSRRNREIHAKTGITLHLRPRSLQFGYIVRRPRSGIAASVLRVSSQGAGFGSSCGREVGHSCVLRRAASTALFISRGAAARPHTTSHKLQRTRHASGPRTGHRCKTATAQLHVDDPTSPAILRGSVRGCSAAASNEGKSSSP